MVKNSSSVLPFQGSDEENPDNKSPKQKSFPFGVFRSENKQSNTEKKPDDIKSFLTRVTSRKRKGKLPENSINNSLVSLGIAMATSTTKDIHQGFILFLVASSEETNFSVLKLSSQEYKLDAIREGSMRDIEYMMEIAFYREKINLFDKANTFTLMHYAAQYDQDQILVCLAQNGGDINAKTAKIGLVPLHVAAKYNSTKAAKALIDLGADIDVETKGKETPLLHCCQHSSHQICEMILMEAKRRNVLSKVVNHHDNEHYYPIHIAGFYSDQRMMEIMLRYGANIYKKNYIGRLASHYAVLQKTTDALEILLQHAKAKGMHDFIKISNKEGGTILHLAADHGSVEAARVCLKYGAEIEAQTNELFTPLHIAAMNGKCDICEYLTSMGANVNAKDSEEKTTLHHAALSNNVLIIESMINKGANIESTDKQNQTPLLAVIWKGCTAAVKKLLELGADITATDDRGRHCLHYVAEQHDHITMDVLLEHGASSLINRPDDNGVLPTFIAAEMGAILVLYRLVRNGGSLELSDDHKNTVLHLAAMNNHRDTVKYILDYTKIKDINARNANGQKPIHLASKFGHNRVVNHLIKFGAEINNKDLFCNYPLHYAARSGHTTTVELLLDKRAKINVVDRSDKTALYLACANGHTETAKLLLTRGADPTAINNQGLSCLDIAIENNQTEIGLQIIRSKYWEKAMENRKLDGYTPMKRLIEKLPDVASIVMDRCISYNQTEDGNKEVVFNFRYLESPPFDTRLKDVRDNYTAASSLLSSQRVGLMTHPLIRAYRHYKWNTSIKFFYYVRVAVCLLFLLAVSVPIGLNIREYYEYIRNTTGNVAPTTNKPVQVPKIYIKNISQSFLELAIEVMALSISLPFEREVTNLTVQIGAMCIFLAIVNFLAQLKRAFGIGLYLTMFITIMKTIIRASLVIILFLLAFAIAFYMVLRQIPEFSEMGYSIVRVITMMVGDIGFAETFQQLYLALKWNELTAGVKLIPSVEVLVPDKRESHDVYNQIKQQELLIKAILDRLDDFRSDVFQRFATNKEDIINVKKEVLESVKERVKKDDDYLL
ncbi:Transient receptor potential cation channel subfamily A member 1 [Trichoplax sp. H2]|nr:Transient receptor potential cation channel subfamily A member 1 [Trichoplax sp. H2]|eukprot:RDD41715.1 Transient receptor potential cation channel subfamily A member 1 [Trichoplax sp. H2]